MTNPVYHRMWALYGIRKCFRFSPLYALRLCQKLFGAILKIGILQIYCTEIVTSVYMYNMSFRLECNRGLLGLSSCSPGDAHPLSRYCHALVCFENIEAPYWKAQEVRHLCLCRLSASRILPRASDRGGRRWTSFKHPEATLAHANALDLIYLPLNSSLISRSSFSRSYIRDSR